MVRSLCVWLAVATVSVSACSDSNSGNTDAAGGSGSGGSGMSGGTGGAGGTGGGGSGGSGAGGATGGSTAGTGGAPRDGSVDINIPVDLPPPSDATFDSAPVPTTIPLDRAPGVFADVICEKVFACCSDQERAANPFLASQAGCSLGLGALLVPIVPQAQGAMAKGRATYEPTVLANCLRDYQAQSCNQLRINGGLSAYRMCKFIRPLVPVGGACNQHIECIDGYCQGVTPTADGACLAKKADGQQCAGDDECTGGRCDTATLRCAAAPASGLCTALRL